MKIQYYSRTKHLALMLGAVLLAVASAYADPITLNLAFSPGGYTVPDGTGNPCSRTLHCLNGTPLGADFIIRADVNSTPLSTITYKLNNPSVTLDVGQSAIVNLGSFTFTGAVPQGTFEYNIRLGALGSNAVNGFMASLSFSSNGIFVTSLPQSPQGLNSLLTLNNGTVFQLTTVTTSNGEFNVRVTNLGNGAPVPEPATLLLLGSGLAGLGGYARRRRKQSR